MWNLHPTAPHPQSENHSHSALDSVVTQDSRATGKMEGFTTLNFGDTSEMGRDVLPPSPPPGESLGVRKGSSPPCRARGHPQHVTDVRMAARLRGAGADIPGAVWEGTVSTHEEHHLDREREDAGPKAGPLPGVWPQLSSGNEPRGAKSDEQFVICTAFGEVLMLTIRIHFGLQVGEFF